MPQTTILIVEDEIIVAADLANKLVKLGYTVIGSTDCGEEALALAREHHPELVLMDIVLAGPMDGVETAEKIRRELDLPVIFLTAHSDRTTLDRAKLSAPFGYILKPFEKVELETQIEMALYKHQAERKLRESEERYRLLFDRNPDGVFVVDASGRFQVVNPACEAISGYTKEELLGMTFMELCAPEELGKTVKHFEITLQQLTRPQLETALIRKDGRRAEVWVVGEPVVDENNELLVHCTAKNITERRQAEEALRASEENLRQTNSQLEVLVQQRTIELQRTNQALRMLCACNEAVSRMDDEQTLMQEICRIAVEIGGYRMAWIGLAENDAEKNVRPVAHAGMENGYLESARITWKDNERGQGPTGMAIRTGKMQVSQDFQTDPRLAPWRQEALRRGFRRSIVLPLRQNKAVIGAINIYSSESVDFSEAHVKVLLELSEDMAFGLATLKMRTTIRESRDRLRALAGELTLAEQRERRRLAIFLHDHLQQLLVGAKFRAEVLGRTADTTTKQRAQEIEDLLAEIIATSRSLTAELNPPILTKGGLAVGLEWLARWMADKHGLCVQLTMDPEVSPLTDDVKVLVFESVRELLFNVVKHAHTESASVRMLQERDGQMRIIICDNGVGYDPSLVVLTASQGGFGLFSIRERLDLIGGELEIKSSPGQGCQFTIIMPSAAGKSAN